MKSFLIIFLMFNLIANAQLSKEHKQLIGKDSTHLSFFNGHFLTPETGNAFLKMKEAAAKDSIDIKIVSAYRSYAHQKSIWNKKYALYHEQGLSDDEIFRKITDYSTIPGTSRHHWGTDIDIISENDQMPNQNVLQEKHFQKGGAFHKMYVWLKENANDFGFYETYTNVASRKGFKYEPWHYSYRPRSREFLSTYLEEELYEHCVDLPVKGLKETDKSLKYNYLEQQILDINPHLQVKNE